MKRKLTNKTLTLAKQLNEEYMKIFDALLESVEDEDYTKSEVNYFLRKTLLDMIDAMAKETSVKDYTSHNKKKYVIEVNKSYHEWHSSYDQRMKKCDSITYSCYLSVIFYFVTLVAVSAFISNAITNWLWMIIPGIISLFFIVRKILLSRKMKLAIMHTYGDIIMFILVTLVCVLSTYYFMIFLWIYDLIFMIYLQKHIVEEDI